MDGGQPLAAPGARIGPNAILQLLPVLDRLEGRAARDRLLRGIALPPADAGMWPEAACRAAHLAVWQGCGDRAGTLLAAAGQGTADYILAHRIPRPAQALIRALPAALGARLLTAAIARHAWTFVGSGRFAVLSRRPLTLIGLATLSAFALMGAGCSESKAPAEKKAPQLMPVSVLEVQAQKLPLVLDVMAQTEGAKESDVRAQVGGILLKRF